MSDLFTNWAARKGAEFGYRLADPHANKPSFVFIVALLVLGGGAALAWHFKSTSEGLFWTGVVLMVLGGVGILRGFLLLFGKDFEKH